MYEFKEEDVYRFRDTVGAMARKKGNELEFALCPYCHGGGSRDKNTFFINLNTGQFECKRSSCGVKGNMLTLARDFNFSISDEVNRYYNMNDYNSKFRKFKEAKRIESKEPAVRYLLSRGISEVICRKYEITTRKDNFDVLVFPFRDDKGEMRFIKYRNTIFVKGVTGGSKEWCEKDCMPVLFGMNHCTGFERLVMTEGQVDSLSLAEAGIENAVSVPTGCNGFTWVPHCWDWLVQFKELVVFGDCEKGIVTLAETMAKRFPHKVRVVRIEDYLGCKDANEILQKHGKAALHHAVNNAAEVPAAQIKKLSQVEAIDILNTEAISTGIKEVDAIFSGGFHLGQLILLTGKRGDGKSTFMSQLICNATEQGYKTFAYSGELMDFYFKRWIDMQFVGKKELRNSEIDMLNAWYDGKIYLYDNNVIDTEEMEDLLKVVETAICKYDTKFICIDNLMTALEVSANEDLYRAQSAFTGKLAKLAKIHNVVILLVAHPRKSREGFTNDDVSGSADITNRVDVVMSYTRTGADDPDERELKVTKNRLTGKTTNENNKIFLYYSQESKRIVGRDRDFLKVYGWRKEDANEFMDAAQEEDIPF